MALELIFFDMEGTLFSKDHVTMEHREDFGFHSLWSRLMHELGPEATTADQVTVRKWIAGGYDSYIQWCEETLFILQKYGLNKPLFEQTMAQVSLNKGVRETLAALNQKGIKTAIISGGFMAQARQAQQQLRINHSFAAVDLFWNESGDLEHWNIFPSDFKGKVDFVHLIRREYGLPLESCGFVGDGGNDIYVAQEVGTSFAYQAEPDLQDVATYSIESFEEILAYID
jgi:phosphoserine phosphatase